MKVEFTILGEAASKANSRKIVKINGKTRSAKSEKALGFERDALRQIPPAARVRMDGPVSVTLRMFYASERPDLDESLVLDILQDRFDQQWGMDFSTTPPQMQKLRTLIQAGVYRNDRQVREKHIYHGIDKKNPRVEVVVEPIEEKTKSL